MSYLKQIEELLQCIKETLSSIKESSIFNNIIEAGECRVQKEYRIVLRDICENNNIKEGDIIIVYVKKK